MDKLDEIKLKWAKKQDQAQHYEAHNLSQVIRRRVQLHLRESMKYFWASFVLQLIVYALYAHVTIKYFYDPRIVGFALSGILIFIPFTYMLLRKFKQLGARKPGDDETQSVFQYLVAQRDALQGFFRFKVRYEWMLIPLSTFFGTWLVFKIYVPGGPAESPTGVVITSVITLLSCYIAIRNENKKGFSRPLAKLEDLLKEFSESEMQKPE